VAKIVKMEVINPKDLAGASECCTDRVGGKWKDNKSIDEY